MTIRSLAAVWKYTLQLNGGWSVRMPDGARILRVEGVDGQICLWALVDPEAEKVSREFLIVGTGHTVPASAFYHGTAVIAPYVWHVFE